MHQLCADVTQLSFQYHMEIGASFLAQMLTLATATAMSNDILHLAQESHVSTSIYEIVAG